MRIFRIEHNRDACTATEYREGGSSLTGHGPHSGCYGSPRPNFGSVGNPPYKRMMEYERCAVTVDQFMRWISPDRTCRNETRDCANNGRSCYLCGISYTNLRIPDDWSIVVYEVQDNAEDQDWRIDADQVVFNPEFAQRVGTITQAEVFAMNGQPVRV
jgi:hypothetical protein